MRPARRAIALSDLDRPRAWFLWNWFRDIRTAREERSIPTPCDKQWPIHAFDALWGKMKRGRPKEEDLENRAPLEKFY